MLCPQDYVLHVALSVVSKAYDKNHFSFAGVQASLTGLYQAIEARLALYKPLLSLQGRLDLVVAQTPPADPLSSHLAAGPMVSSYPHYCVVASDSSH